MNMLAAIMALVGAIGPAQAAQGNTVKAPPLNPDIPNFSIDSRDFIFPSGLRIIIQSDKSAPVVAFTTYFDKGSTSDPVGKEGIAHFVEHMWFKSRHVDGSDIRAWDILSENGCLLNASTSTDWTNYMTVCPDSALDTLMKFASLRMTDPVKGVTAEEVESEREVIRNELRMRMENGGGEALRYIYDRIYGPEHPYHRMTIGTHGSLDNVTLEDIQQFTKDNYRPEFTTIVIVGNFDPEEATSKIFEHFSPELLHPDLTEEHMMFRRRPGVKLDDFDPNNPDPNQIFWTAIDPASPPNDPKELQLLEDPPRRNQTFGLPPTDKPYNSEVGVFDAPIADRTAVVGWSAPGGYQGNDLVMQVAAWQVQNQMRWGLRYDDRYVKNPDTRQKDIGCFALPQKANTNVLCFATITEKADPDEAVENMLDQLAEMWNPEMLAIPEIKKQIENQFAITRLQQLQLTLASLDRVSGLRGARATDIADFAHHTGNPRYHSEIMTEVGKLNYDSMVQFISSWLTRSRAAAVVLNPIPDEDLVLDSSESDYHGAGATEDRVVSTIDPDDITEELIIEETDIIDLEKREEFKLKNGMRVVLLKHGEVPWMSASVVASGGNRTDTIGMDSMVSIFTDDPRFEVDERSRLRELEPMRFAGAWNDYRTDNYSVMGIDAPAGNSEQAFWMLRQRLDGLKPDLGGRAQWLQRSQKRLKGAWKSKWYWAGSPRYNPAAVFEKMGSDHPAFHLRTIDDYQKLKRVKGKDVLAYINQKWAAKNLTLVVVGNMDVAKVKADAEQYFSSYNRTGSARIPQPEPAPVKPFEQQIVLFDDPRKTQTDVNLYCRMASGAPETDAVREVATQMLSDHLFDELRARSGVTYGARAGQRSYVGGTGVLRMTGLIQNNGVGLAAKTFRQVTQDAADGKFPMNRFGASRLSRARSYGVGQQAIEDVNLWITSVVGRDLDWSVRTERGQRLAAVTVEDMTEMMKSCVDTQIITMAGPVDVVSKVLDDEGLEYEIFDHESRAMDLLEKYDRRAAKKYKKFLEKQAEEEAKKAEENEDEEKSGEDEDSDDSDSDDSTASGD